MDEKDLKQAAEELAIEAAKRTVRYVRPQLRSLKVPMLAPGSAPCSPVSDCHPAYCDPPPWGG